MRLNNRQRSEMSLSSSKLLLSVFLAVAVLGCNKKEEGKAASQVAAKVNADEITVSQVNYVLSRGNTANLTPEAAIKAKSEILEKLIDQQLAKQQAIAMKLDRTPAIVQAIEAARNEILSRAYLEKIAGALPKPTQGDVKKYYAEHPELFAARRVFNLEEMVVEPKEGLADSLGAHVSNAKSLQEIAAWLGSQGAKFAVNRGVRAAETLPLELLPRLNAMKDGELKLVQTGGRLVVFHLVASQTVPVEESVAAPRIQQFLFNQTISKAIAAETKSLRDKADVSYVGEFSGGPGAAVVRAKEQAEAGTQNAAKAKAEADALAKANQEASVKAAAEADAQAKAMSEARAESDAVRQSSKKSDASAQPRLNQDHIEKGLGGLK